jgi:hypothetical protein
VSKYCPCFAETDVGSNRILLLIKTWLQLDYEDMDEAIIGVIKAFARSVHGSQTMVVLARDIVVLLEQKVSIYLREVWLLADIAIQLQAMHAAHLSPPFRSAGQVTIPKASEIMPLEIAVAFTIMEGGLFSKITHFDCIAQLQRVSGTKTIERAINMSNRVMNWVKKYIVHASCAVLLLTLGIQVDPEVRLAGDPCGCVQVFRQCC